MLASLESDRARIKTLDAQISDLTRFLSAAQAERAVLRGRLNSYRYPVFTLPNELVSEIFVHFLPAYPLCPPLTGTRSPELLPQICRKWRDIALSTPTLWRAISLDSGEAAVEQRERVKDWLRRFGYCPLSICMDQDFTTTVEVKNLLLKIMAAHCTARREYIRLDVSHSDFSVKETLPLLCDLEFQAYNVPSVTFPEMPRLRAATLWDFSYPVDLLPWSQLTSLTLIAKEPHGCTPLL
ncbi:hypothetical protein C8R47DRAFT_1325308 [Mycena vitilis]|nr:hypothetical protein C8R47DRAFT_1325308 [Mycena vitilis]